MPDAADTRPLVISLCGTFLKPEMQSIYRQVTGLRRWRTKVYTQLHRNEEMFPFEPVVTLKKLARPRLRGNFILRFWFKYVVKQWPPPFPINKQVQPYYPYDLVTLLKSDKPDLVHVYYGHKAVHYLEMLQAWGGPWVVSFHGVDVSKFLDRNGYAEKLKIVFAEAKLVMARSESLLTKLEKLGCPREKLRLNRTPIPLEHLIPAVRTPPADGQWRFIQACRLIQKKGILTTLEALTIVKRRFPHFRYLICGDGPLREKIVEVVAQLGLSGNVEVPGWLTQEQLIAEYRRAHLFLHPSEKTKADDQEGIPNSMLEAMATGLPVVATWHGGIPEAVTNEHDGLLVSEHSPEELAAAIMRMMSDASLLSCCSENAAASLRAKFGSETQIAAMEDVYSEAITASSGCK
ncbi:MAG: glycosyltransferase [Verrucomicrobia bacterium]|nr:glycosyltransferase [Verrucomicrobiota bacterium]